MPLTAGKLTGAAKGENLARELREIARIDASAPAAGRVNWMTRVIPAKSILYTVSVSKVGDAHIARTGGVYTRFSGVPGTKGKSGKCFSFWFLLFPLVSSICP